MAGRARKFVFRLLMLALVLTCLGYGLFYFVFPGSFFPLFPVLPVLLFMVTIIVHFYLVKVSEIDSPKFISKYLGAMGLKTLIYLCFIIVFLVLNSSDAIPFLISFFVMYFAFTLFEVVSILNTMKNSS